MGAKIQYDTESALGTLFTTANFTDELHKYLGLDPAVSSANQPLDVNDLLLSLLHIVEGDQWRVILPKTITLSLPYKAFCALDNRVYLPFGEVSSITTFAYTDSSGVAQTLASSNYTLYSEEPSFIWADNWYSVMTLSTTVPVPVTLTYTTGYTAFADIPRGTLQALKVLAYHHFVNRGDEDKPLPMAYKHHVSQDMLNHRRSLEFVT